jgi:hypothetical protein
MIRSDAYFRNSPLSKNKEAKDKKVGIKREEVTKHN